MNRQSFIFRGLEVVIFLTVLAVFAVLAMFLWNSLLSDIFGLPALNYWQALGVLALSRILFSGFCGGFLARNKASGMQRK
jgi:hypothetical protein